MKRVMPTSLINFLAASPGCTKADLFVIVLTNGQVIYATEGQFDITVAQGTPGWSPTLGLSGVLKTIPGTTMCWSPADPVYPWTLSTFATPSVSVKAKPGKYMGIQYLSGLWAEGSVPPHPYVDAVGDATAGPHAPADGYVSAFDHPTAYRMCLMGSFADGSGNLVAPPFVVGLTRAAKVPPGATQLFLGPNDANILDDNLGALKVSVIQANWLPGETATFSAGQFGVWSRGKITTEAGHAMGSNTMELTCTPQQNTLFPGLALGLLNGALGGLFDGATVWVFTSYFDLDAYGDVSAGIETKFQGTITKIQQLGRNKVVFECADPLYMLNTKVPTRLYQSNCPWAFCDDNCTLALADYTVNFTAASGSNASSLTPSSAFSQADNYFAQGVVTCLTGANTGLSQTVKIHKSGVLTLVLPFLLPVTAGDTFGVIKGCDKTLSMCKATVKASGTSIDNSINFGGTPFVPPPSLAV